MTSDDIVVRAGRREWLGLAVLALPTMLLSLDLSVLFLALPHLSEDLGASSTQQLWITDIYGFMTAGFLITMGNLGDRVGRRRLLLIGAVAFGSASVLAAFSTSPEMLIAARALLGAAGATLLPSTLALIRTMFGDPRQLGVAIAGWTTSYMAGVALGPVVGGAMLEAFWWGSVFLLAVPVMALLVAAGPALLPEQHAEAPGRLDLTSVALSLAAILPVVHGLKELARQGWDVPSVLAIGAGVIFAVLFVRRQRRVPNPLLDLRLFGIRALRVTLALAVVIAAVQNGNMLMVAQHLQMVNGLSPLRAGLWLLLPSLALILTINAAPRLTRRFRPGAVFASGILVSVVGYLLQTQVRDASGTALLVVAVVIVYAGIGPAGALINQLVLGSAPPQKAGTAASLASTGGELGIALGIATLGSVGTAIYRARLNVAPDMAGDAAHDGIAAAAAAADELSGADRAVLLDAAGTAFTAGLNVLGAISAVLFVAVAVVAATALRHVPPTGQT